VNINNLEYKKGEEQWRSLNIQIKGKKPKDRDHGNDPRIGTRVTRKTNQISETNMTSATNMTEM